MPQDPLDPIIITNSRRKVRKRRRFRPGAWVWRSILVIGAVGLGGAALSRIAEPYTMRHYQKQETQEIRDQLAQAQEENRSLQHQIQMLQSGLSWETEARRLGYIKKGEVALQVLYAPAPKPTE